MEEVQIEAQWKPLLICLKKKKKEILRNTQDEEHNEWYGCQIVSHRSNG